MPLSICQLRVLPSSKAPDRAFDQTDLDKTREFIVNRSMQMRINKQCSGCIYYAAFSGNFGICVNSASSEHGRIVYEHGGCPFQKGN